MEYLLNIKQEDKEYLLDIKQKVITYYHNDIRNSNNKSPNNDNLAMMIMIVIV